MYENIITKDFINTNIRPFSGNDALHDACVRETIMMDLGLPMDVTNRLLNDDLCDIEELVDENLRLSIGYFVYARAIRSANVTISKYGATTKSSDNSYPADSEKIVSDSTYYKSCGENILKTWKCVHVEDLKKWEVATNKIVNDTWLKCKIIGD